MCIRDRPYTGAILAAGDTAAAGPDTKAAGPDFEAAGPDFEAAGPDFEVAGPDFEAARHTQILPKTSEMVRNGSPWLRVGPYSGKMMLPPLGSLWDTSRSLKQPKNVQKNRFGDFGKKSRNFRYFPYTRPIPRVGGMAEGR